MLITRIYMLKATDTVIMNYHRDYDNAVVVSPSA